MVKYDHVEVLAMNEYLKSKLSTTLKCTAQLCKNTYDPDMHMHPWAEIIYVTKGCLEVIADAKKLMVPCNTAIFINNDTTHMILESTSGDTAFYRIEFLPELVYCYGDDYIDKPSFVWFITQKPFCLYEIPKDSAIANAIENIHILYETKNLGFMFALQANLLTVCDYFYKVNPTNSGKECFLTNKGCLLLQKALDFIRKNDTDKITENRLVRFLDSPEICSVFKKATGMSIEEYSKKHSESLHNTYARDWQKDILSMPYNLSCKTVAYPQKLSKIKIQDKTPIEKRLISARSENKITQACAIHTFFKIIIVYSGEGVLETPRQRTLLKPGSIVVLKNYERYHFIKFSSDTQVIFLQFYDSALCYGKTQNPHKNYLQKTIAEGTTHISIYDDATHILESCHKKLYFEKSNLTSETDAFIRSQYLNIIYALIQNRNTKPEIIQKHHDKIKNSINSIIDYVDDHYIENLSLKNLGEKFGVSYSHLSRKFKEETGKTFNGYINEKRMSHANKLLSQTTYSISKIASCLGYCRRSHFTDLYTETFGITPSQYRENEKED